jgi:hypothetical protein
VSPSSGSKSKASKNPVKPVSNPKKLGHMEDLRIDGRIILNCMLEV